MDIEQNAAPVVIDLNELAIRNLRGTYITAFGPIDPNLTANDIDYEICEMINGYAAKMREPVDQRERFEQACYAHYLERHAAGKTEDHEMPAGPREELLWRDKKGNYGVLMFNAAWWAWEQAVKP